MRYFEDILLRLQFQRSTIFRGELINYKNIDQNWIKAGSFSFNKCQHDDLSSSLKNPKWVSWIIPIFIIMPEIVSPVFGD